MGATSGLAAFTAIQTFPTTSFQFTCSQGECDLTWQMCVIYWWVWRSYSWNSTPLSVYFRDLFNLTLPSSSCLSLEVPLPTFWTSEIKLQIRIFPQNSHIFRKMPGFFADSQKCGEGPFHPDAILLEQAALPWPSMCVLRRTTRRRDLVTLWLHRDWHRYSENMVPNQEATFQVVIFGDWPSRLILWILIAVARAVRRACWH